MTDRTWERRLKLARDSREPFLGHKLLPIPLRDNKSRTERVSTYVELDLYRFFEEYAIRGGFRSVSEVVRRLAILGAIAEGYQFANPKNRREYDEGNREGAAAFG